MAAKTRTLEIRGA